MPSISDVLGEDRKLRKRDMSTSESSKYWGMLWAETYADCFECRGLVKVTQADIGMLKRMDGYLGAEISLYDFIPWVMLNWTEVTDTIHSTAGLEKTPRKAKHRVFVEVYRHSPRVLSRRTKPNRQGEVTYQQQVHLCGWQGGHL